MAEIMNPQMIQSFLGAVPMPMVLIGANERVLEMNTWAVAVFGPNLTGRHYVTALRNPALLDCVEEVFRLSQPCRARYLTTLLERDCVYDVSASPMTLEAGGLGVLMAFEDVTDREQAQEIRRDFVANVSHELKTPLTAMLGFIETLLGPAKDDPKAQVRFLEIMRREAVRMDRLVQDLLSLSRVENQGRQQPRGQVDVVALVQSCTATLRSLAQAGGVEIHTTGHLDPVFVQGDSDQLVQVFTNLIENGIKYGGAGGEVTINIVLSEREMAFRGPGVRIEVRDKGEGFDPVHIPRLTERFYRIDGHRSREQGGTGLGLAIVKHIVNRHRGRFKIESAQGQGSVFSVMLPVG